MPPTWSTSMASVAIVGAPVSGLTIPPAGMEARQPCGPSSDVTMPNRPRGVFSGCDIAVQRDGSAVDIYPLGVYDDYHDRARPHRASDARGARRARGPRRTRSRGPFRGVQAAVLGHARARCPDRGTFRHVRDDPGLHRAGVPGCAVGVTGAGDGDVPLGWASLPDGGDQ